jgi:hypothetical protein
LILKKERIMKLDIVIVVMVRRKEKEEEAVRS